VSEPQSQQEMPQSQQEMQQEIERTREQLGETVEELVAKADVKVRVRHKAAKVKAKVQDTTAKVKAKANQSQLVRRRWPLAVTAGVAAAGIVIMWRRRKA
jgi:succinyl-CoA synthetase beta subunit